MFVCVCVCVCTPLPNIDISFGGRGAAAAAGIAQLLLSCGDSGPLVSGRPAAASTPELMRSSGSGAQLPPLSVIGPATATAMSMMTNDLFELNEGVLGTTVKLNCRYLVASLISC